MLESLKLRNSCGEPEKIDLVERNGKLVMVHEDGTEEDFNNTMSCGEH